MHPVQLKLIFAHKSRLGRLCSRWQFIIRYFLQSNTVSIHVLQFAVDS